MHRVAALLLVVAVVGWGVLLSPPLAWLRPLLGLPEHLPASRFNGYAAEIIPLDPGDAKLYLARIAHYYHALFAVLVYSMLVLGARLYSGQWRDALVLGLSGSALTVVGGLGYAYVAREPFLHGVFISGLALLFSAGIVVATRLRPRDVLEKAQYAGLLLLLVGGAIGAYVGSSYMDREKAASFIEAKILSRYDPDLAEHNSIWRAWVAHEHTMIALVLAMSFLIALRVLETPSTRVARLASLMVLGGLVATAVASYAVWPLGGIAHTVITPASLILLLGSTILSFTTRAKSPLEPQGLLAYALRIGSLTLWAAVILPGVIVAVSLRKPTPLINPAFRDPAWDWAELAYNIGHWHILLASWGVVLFLTAIATENWLTTSRAKIAVTGGWLTLLGYTASSLTVNLYMLGNPPEPYQPNPYSNHWLSLLVEPSLAVMGIGVAVASILLLENQLRQHLRS